jgi:hypothetical protein
VAAVVAVVVAAAAPAAGAVRPTPVADVPTRAHLARARIAAAGVSYGGGPVMHSEHTHVIFWTPSGSGLTFDPGYEEQVATFLGRVAADSRSSASLFGLIGQYGDGTGPATYASRFAGAIDDTDPLPTDPGSICSEPVAPPLGTGPGWNACVNDSGIQAELQNVVSANHLPAGLGEMYLLVTPNGLGSCFGAGPSDCALGGTDNQGYCGYHSATGAPEILYAVVPYNAVARHCQSGNPRPNASTADPAISTLAHEFAEIATDPLGDGWSDSSGDEIADLCITNFGPNLGGSTGPSAYNEVVGGGHYYLQELWSNHTHSCEPAPKPDTVSLSLPRRAQADRTLSLSAYAIDPQGTVIGYRWSFGDGTGGHRMQPRHVYRKAGTFVVSLRITDSWDNWTYATQTLTVRRPAPPMVSIVARHGATVRFRTNAAIASFRCSVDRGPARACRSPFRARGLRAGRHTIRIRARDSFGQLGRAARYAFTVA